MKALLFLLALSIATPSMAVVTGNGGGGVNQNGVYKTFYSAGMYVNPEAETEIPGAELYTTTIMSIAGQNKSTAKLLALGLPIAERKFYKILEDRMEAGVMDRLLNEYARIVNQPVKNLAIFAITDIKEKTTYLLPTFYKLSENEQASILFHEAYWIINPSASYPEVVEAESSFQKYIESRERGEFDSELVKILGKVLEDGTLALKTSYVEDARLQKTPSLISKDGRIKVKYLFGNNADLCVAESERQNVGDTIFGKSKYKDGTKIVCKLTYDNLQTILVLSKKFPNSYFLKELMRFISANNELFVTTSYVGKEAPAKYIENLFNMTVNLEKVEASKQYLSFGWGEHSYKHTFNFQKSDLK